MSDSDLTIEEMNESDGDHNNQSETSLSELRRLLIGPLEDRVSVIQQKIDSDELQPEDVSRVLPEAIKLREMRDDKVGKALEASIASAIRTSINKDRKILADALFPVLGPAIRKAIASVILGMLQSFNQVLEHSLSIEGLKWRIEAFRTKKPFAEIVLLKTLLFQVEQVFLIHKSTGLVLQHVTAKEVTAQDPDLVSGMLTAIQDFVSDSFSNENDDTLDTLRMGMDRSVWIERGPHALLAVVIHGTPPLGLRSEFRDVIDDINRQGEDALNTFQGDTASFDIIRPRLESCLQYQIRKTKTRYSPWLWVSCLSIVLLIAFGAFIIISQHQSWLHFLKNLKEEPGIVIANTEKRSGAYHIYGLRDAAAASPSEILRLNNINPDKVIFHWEPYYSFYPEFLLKRVKRILKPAETTILTLDNKILHARGSASHIWIRETKKLALVIPGIEGYRDETLINTDQKNWQIIAEKIESQRIYFNFDETELTVGSLTLLNELNLFIKKFFQLSEVIRNKPVVEIRGHTDSIGKDETNRIISQKRAETVLAFFSSKGNSPGMFITKGLGAGTPLQKEISDADRALNRCVTFRVTTSE